MSIIMGGSFVGSFVAAVHQRNHLIPNKDALQVHIYLIINGVEL